jgi:hypothetical protein
MRKLLSWRKSESKFTLCFVKPANPLPRKTQHLPLSAPKPTLGHFPLKKKKK